MTFVREIINVTATLGGAYLGSSAVMHFAPITQSSPTYAVGAMAASFVGAYVGNHVCNGYTNEELRKSIRHQVINRLKHKGFSKEESEHAFELYYPRDLHLHSGVARNIGNTLFTGMGGSLGGLVGLLGGTALSTTMGRGVDMLLGGGGNKFASYGFVAGTLFAPILGSLAGGYIGNKILRAPSNVGKATTKIVKQIVTDREQEPTLSFAERIKQREAIAPAIPGGRA